MVHAVSAWAVCIYIFFRGFSQDLNTETWSISSTLFLCLYLFLPRNTILSGGPMFFETMCVRANIFPRFARETKSVVAGGQRRRNTRRLVCRCVRGGCLPPRRSLLTDIFVKLSLILIRCGLLAKVAPLFSKRHPRIAHTDKNHKYNKRHLRVKKNIICLILIFTKNEKVFS